MKRNGPNHRPAFAVMLVLAVLSVALSVSYAMLRMQSATGQLQDNSDVDTLAQQAAQTGLSAALRRMHESGWTITTSVTGSLSATQSFSATFTTGDEDLAPSDANYSEWPYRVTLNVAGFAQQPGNSRVVANHRIRAVVRLAPKAVGPLPTHYNTLMNYTVCQHSKANASIELPCNIRGTVRWQDSFEIGSYPTPSGALQRYLSDLNAMRNAGYPDFRPITGTVYLPYNKTSSSTQSLLTSHLGLSTVDTAQSNLSPTFPTNLTSYRLYTGGQTYSATLLTSNTLRNQSLSPNPQTNPLGVFVYAVNGNLSIRENVTVQGTIITADDVSLDGTNINLQPAPQPALAGTTSSICLPAIMVGDDMDINNANATVTGLVAVADAFRVTPGSQNVRANITGRLWCSDFSISGRSEWQQSSTTWSILYTWFNNQRNEPGGTPYYPVFLSYFGLSPYPVLTVTQETTEVRHHWLDASNPVYVPGPGDAGLRWTLVRWKELD